MMDMSNHLIKLEQRRIQRLIDLAREKEENAEPGSLYVKTVGGSVYCYESFYEKGRRVRKRYLGGRDSEAVHRHCGLKFRRELMRRLEENRELLEVLEKNYNELDASSVIGMLPGAYSKVSSNMYVDEKYRELKTWADMDYPVNSIPFSKSKNYARDGRRVRSKGECIIYNMLLDREIPFRYDSLMKITKENGQSKVLSPDFLINCYDDSRVVIEHLGRMDDLKYALDYGDKCYWYFQAGFVPGRNYFVTSDDLNSGTDSNAIARVIDQVERMFWGY